MISRPFFSVVIDNHNYGRFLGAALDSVLAQDFPAADVEVIVVDDGSTDDSRDVLGRYRGRVRAVLQERQGQASAFNRGFREARGEVVCLLDSDDLWSPGKLSAVARRFDDLRVGAVQHFLRDVDGALAPLPQTFPDWPERYRLDDFLEGRARFTATSGLSYRRVQLLKALPIPRELFYYLDDFLTVRALFDSDLANVPDCLGVHRVHGGNWCAGGYESAAKLEVDFRMREIFGAELERWLAGHGKTLSARYREAQEAEVFRRRVLHRALKAQPLEAWRLWVEGARRLPRSARFKLASVLLAVLSPSLYLAVYSAYVGASRLRRLRLRLLPDA